MDQEKFIPTWAHVHAVTDEQTKIVVTVNRSDHRQPRYSISIGTSRQDNRPSPFLNPHLVVTNAKAVLTTRFAETIGRLVKAAEEWIESDAQKHQDEWLAFRQDREQRALDRDKPVQKPGLKSLAKKDAAKRAP